MNVVAAGIIILQINHLSISETGEFTEQHIDKLVIFLRKHNQQTSGMYSEEGILSRLKSVTSAPLAIRDCQSYFASMATTVL
mgnify:FL=1